MRLVPDRVFELDGVSPDVAWNMVDRVFQQTANVVVGVACFTALGLFGFITGGSRWYLFGIAAVVLSAGWRLWIIRRYRQSRDSAPPIAWARRSLWAASAAAASWGAWSGVVLFEPRQNIVVMAICLQGASVLFNAVRFATMRVNTRAQTVLTLLPLLVALVLSGDWTYRLYALFIIPFFANVVSYNTFLYRQTLKLFRQDQEKADLLVRLEAARQDLEVINRHLETLAAMDALTGVANRRAFDLTSAQEWLRAAREARPMSLLLLDIDHFKAYNDFYGHQAGDACLKMVAATAASVLRPPGDLLARYGGEEFAVVLPGSDLDGAMQVAGEILAAIADRALPHDASAFGLVTVSIGAACLVPSADSSAESLTARADAALYAAKRGGRNRVHAAEAVGLRLLAAARS